MDAWLAAMERVVASILLAIASTAAAGSSDRFAKPGITTEYSSRPPGTDVQNLELWPATFGTFNPPETMAEAVLELAK